MTASPLSLRPLLVGALAVALLSQSGCAWTRSKLGMDAKYQDSVQNSPLEVPPGLDLPATTGAVTVPDVTPNPNLAPLTTTAPAPTVATTPAGVAVSGIDSFTIRDIRDKHGYLEALGKPRIAEVKRTAAIAEANAFKEASIAQADAERETRERQAEALKLAQEAEARRERPSWRRSR